jgi:hypothetical protein
MQKIPFVNVIERTMNAWAPEVFLFKATTLFPAGIRSHDPLPLLQSPRWQAETLPLGHAARAGPKVFEKSFLMVAAPLPPVLILSLYREGKKYFWSVAVG